MIDVRTFFRLIDNRVYQAGTSLSKSVFKVPGNGAVDPVIEELAQGLIPVEDMQSNTNSAYYCFVGSAKHLGLEPFRNAQGVEEFSGAYLNMMLEDSILTWPEYYTIIAFLYLLGDERSWNGIQQEYQVAPAIHAMLVHLAQSKNWEAQFENGSFYVEEDFCSRLAGLLTDILEPIQKRFARLDGLKPCTYQHPIDRKIMRYISGLPGCEALCAKTVNVLSRQKELAMMGNAMFVTPITHPRLYKLLAAACAILDLHIVPRMCIDPSIQGLAAYTIGYGDKAYIAISQRAAVLLDDRELLFLLGREIGHIQCGHVVFRNIVDCLFDGVSMVPLVGKMVSFVTNPMLYSWIRYSEITADRAGLLCCQSREAALRTMMKIAGHPLNSYETLCTRSLCDRVNEFEETLAASGIDRFWNVLISVGRSEPYIIYRASELLNWLQSGEYDEIVETDCKGRRLLGSRVREDADMASLYQLTERSLGKWFGKKFSISSKSATREIRGMIFSGNASEKFPLNRIYEIALVVHQKDANTFQYFCSCNYAAEDGTGRNIQLQLNRPSSSRDELPREFADEFLKTNAPQITKVIFKIK
ncbi:MAG: M48 family metallopeptidase [Thermoguttaceae bacterium]|nr:M48 family metallopeptidase [Thermoguttaceae bacterium]